MASTLRLHYEMRRARKGYWISAARSRWCSGAAILRWMGKVLRFADAALMFCVAECKHVSADDEMD